MYLFSNLTPTLDGDSLFGYLGLAREYFIEGKITPVDYYFGSTFPQNGQLITTLGFLLNDQITAQLFVSWLMGVFCCFTIIMISRMVSDFKTALIAVIIWYGTYSVAFINQSAKIDLAWTFFDLLSIYAFFNWFYKTGYSLNNKWLIVSGFLISIAIGIKQASAFTIFVISIGIILKYVNDKKFNFSKIVISISFYILPIIFSLHWIIRTYLLTGSIVYTGGELPNNYGIDGYFKTILEMSMLGNASSFEGPMGKTIGPTLLAVLPLFLFIKKIDDKIKAMLIFCLFMSFLWYNGVQRARHFLPTIAMLSVCSAYIVNLFTKNNFKIGKPILVLIVFCSFFNILPWTYVNFVSVDRISYFYNQDLDDYLKKNLDKWQWYPNYTITNFVKDSLPKDIKIAALSTGNSYYLERKYYGARKTLGPSFTESKSQISKDGFLYKLKENDITHIFINDHVLKKWSLQDSWLNDSGFKKDNMVNIINKGGQHLYKLRYD